MALYQGNGEKMHFFFEEKLMSMKEFLVTILPSLAEMNWFLDKEEIAREWNFLYVLHTGVTKVSSEFGMVHGTASSKSEEVLLTPTFMADVMAKKEGRLLHSTRNVYFSPHDRSLLEPSHELRVTSFKTLWFLERQPFLKRIRVIRDARITTFFIAEKEIWNGNARFSITCMPHAHLNPLDVHKKNTGFEGGCQTAPAKQVFKKPSVHNTHGGDLKALVWNIANTLPSTIEKTLYYLVTREQPTLIMMPGAHVEGNVSKIANALGLTKLNTNFRSEACMKGATILWDNDAICLQQLSGYDNTIHIRVMVLIYINYLTRT